jgi:hypothetical protein
MGVTIRYYMATSAASVVPARAQMATTLGFHIILACLGIALPTTVLLAEFTGLRRGDETALRLARHWSQAMAVLVAVGAVTGTVLSFELGLLWPGLMRQYGPVLLPVRDRGAVLLPRGDLRRDLPVGLAAAVPGHRAVLRAAVPAAEPAAARRRRPRARLTPVPSPRGCCRADCLDGPRSWRKVADLPGPCGRRVRRRPEDLARSH